MGWEGGDGGNGSWILIPKQNRQRARVSSGVISDNPWDTAEPVNIPRRLPLRKTIFAMHYNSRRVRGKNCEHGLVTEIPS